MGRRRPRSCSRTRELRAGAELGALGNRAAGEASSSRRRFAPPSSLPSPLIVPVECDLPLAPSWRTTMPAGNPDLAIAQQPTLEPITPTAQRARIPAHALIPYVPYKAKVAVLRMTGTDPR